ncbi:MAG: glycoside hydrolase family 43 protein [Bacteroidetes bacterium]|nr:glycoside hydrolase family 43 protein [Bacteroidota bacterium]MDA0889446.1 glycoside hydrolase family 43 protein [Bacteroidota bacterium]MDA1085327.1 glycoside hydrolase family 43 protein [Bacteroidota bacterium]
MPEDNIEHINFEELNQNALSAPLVRHIYTADPSAHYFNGKIYIYPSHDVDAGEAFDDLGSHFAMEDYHVISMDSIDSEAVDNGIALHIDDVQWAKQQMWAPDANEKNGKFYLFFPAKDYDGIFRIGVAVSDSPIGPFKAQPNPIKESFSIDPAVFKDEDGSYYMYFGGLWGGQLQRWRSGVFNADQPESPTAFIPDDKDPALLPFVAKMSDDLLEFDEKPKEIQILDENGALLLSGDNERRFFEAAWLHKHNGNYYFSYSTGDTHFICYAIGDNPYGPFTYKGRILNPVVGWTSHHSICQIEGKTYLFYHDSSLSKGVTHLRCIKKAEINYREDGSIITLDPYQ